MNSVKIRFIFYPIVLLLVSGIGAEEINDDWLEANKSNGSENKERSIDEMSINLNMDGWTEEQLNFYAGQVGKITPKEKLVVKGKIKEYAIPIPDKIIRGDLPEDIKKFTISFLLEEFKITVTPTTRNSTGFTFLKQADVKELKANFLTNPKWSRQGMFGMALRQLQDEHTEKHNGMVAITLNHEIYGHIIHIDGDKLEITVGNVDVPLISLKR